MATITLKDGDFGGGVTANFSDDELFLPNTQLPGAKVVIPLTAVAEIESISDDHSGRLKQAAKLGLRGFATVGPVGLAAGILAVRKIKDVNFRVQLKDGRKFVASSGATTYADLKSACIAAGMSARLAGAGSPADQIIAKYLNAKESPEPSAEDRPEAAVPERRSLPASDRRSAPRGSDRPTFGRRRDPRP